MLLQQRIEWRLGACCKAREIKSIVGDHEVTVCLGNARIQCSMEHLTYARRVLFAHFVYAYHELNFGVTAFVSYGGKQLVL